MAVAGKRLLFLGGALYQVPALKCAKAIGCHVILVDQDEAAPGRPFAEIFEKVSTRDVEGVLKIAKKHRVKGVMTYASDSSTYTVAQIAEKLGLPGNPPEAALTLQQKDLFRELQR